MTTIFKTFQEMWNTWLPSQPVENKPVPQPKEPKDNTSRLQRFLNHQFDFRHNCLTGVTEYRPKDKPEKGFLPIDERGMNGMIVDARIKGIHCWNSMVPTLILSTKVASYHPFHLYMEELPTWDGIDRVTPLLRRVSDNELWLKGGRCWLRAMTSQWMGNVQQHANSLVPILISDEQGLGKSTFCRQLLPDSLRSYYVDNLNLAPGTSPEKKLVTKGLINLDEFDKIGEKRQPDLKNLLQMVSVPIYRGKRLGYVTEPRLASFIATTNSRQILCDVSGSRRFLCVEIQEYITEKPIEHKQLYAQLKQELAKGLPDHLSKEEEKELQRHNKAFYRRSTLEDVFHSCYRLPRSDEKGQWFTSAEMFRVLNKHNAPALRGIAPTSLSRLLTVLGVRYKHTNHGNYFHVVYQGNGTLCD